MFFGQGHGQGHGQGNELCKMSNGDEYGTGFFILEDGSEWTTPYGIYYGRKAIQDNFENDKIIVLQGYTYRPWYFISAKMSDTRYLRILMSKPPKSIHVEAAQLE